MENLNSTRALRFGPVAGFTIGSLCMYYFDPERGAKRRSLVLDQVTHSYFKTKSLLDKASRDLRNRSKGLRAKVRALINPQTTISDDILVARIRSKMGRYVSHPHAIEVSVDNQVVTLSGPVLEPELEPFMLSISKLSGVMNIVNRLEAHSRQEHFPDLQGGLPRTGERPDIFQSQWSPATRVLIGLMGGSLLIFGLRKKNASGKIAVCLGLTAGLRAITNLEVSQLLGIGKGKGTIQINKIINIEAPIERVYEFWSNIENFPRFLTDVKEVRVTEEIQSHWNISGPAGTSITWDALLTKKVPNRILAWKTLPGAMIPNAGLLHFLTNDDGGTRIDIKLSYNPPAGALGHFAAHLFGAGPKSKLDDALSQIKTLIEQGPSERQLRRVIR